MNWINELFSGKGNEKKASIPEEGMPEERQMDSDTWAEPLAEDADYLEKVSAASAGTILQQFVDSLSDPERANFQFSHLEHALSYAPGMDGLEQEDWVRLMDIAKNHDFEGFKIAVTELAPKYADQTGRSHEEYTKEKYKETFPVDATKDEHRPDAGKTDCKYCGQKDCDYDCDESQADGFNKKEAEESFDEVGAIMAYESGELDDAGTLDLFSHLIQNGHAWSLQGSYGRTAKALIDAGWLDDKGTLLKDLSEAQESADDSDVYASKKSAIAKIAAYEKGDDCATTIEKDYKLRVSGLSDWNLAEMIAERVLAEKGTATINGNEELEKQLKSVKSGREAAEKKLLSLIGDHTKLDWQKAFKKFEDADPIVAKSEDLYLEAPEIKKTKKETFDEKSDKEKIKDMEGVGKEEEKGVVGKEASKKTASEMTDKIKKKVEKKINEIVEQVLDDALPAVDAPIDGMPPVDLVPPVDAPPVEDELVVDELPIVEIKKQDDKPEEVESKKAGLEDDGIPSARDIADTFVNGNIQDAIEWLGGDLDMFMAVMDILGFGSEEGRSFQRLMRKASKKTADELTDTVTNIKEKVQTTKERLDTQTKESDIGDGTYEGWKNHATWAIALWISNDEGMYNEVNDMVSGIQDIGEAAQAIKDYIEELKPDLGATMWSDIFDGAVGDVDWFEIAEDVKGGEGSANEVTEAPPVEAPAPEVVPEELPPGTASKRKTNEIKSKLGKKEIVAKFKKKAEIDSPWKIIKDENGDEIVARVAPSKREKLSKDKKLHDKKSI